MVSEDQKQLEAESIRMEYPSELTYYFENNYENLKENMDGDNYGDIISPDISVSDELGSSKQIYKCEECEVSYTYKKNLNRHNRSKH